MFKPDTNKHNLENILLHMCRKGGGDAEVLRWYENS